ncbi:MAG: hypothetical protein R3D29_08365 [Nitratireductor sp.]
MSLRRSVGELAVEETGYGNVSGQRVKNLFNALGRGLLAHGYNAWRAVAGRCREDAAIGEPIGRGCGAGAGYQSHLDDHLQGIVCGKGGECDCVRTRIRVVCAVASRP